MMEPVVRAYNSVETGPEEDPGQYSDESKEKGNLLRGLGFVWWLRVEAWCE